MRSNRVLVTGMGCVTPLGVGADVFWEGLVSGRSGVRHLTRFDPAPYATKIAGEIPDFRPEDFLPRREISGSARATQLSLVAARLAVEHAGFSPRESQPERTGVFVGTSIGTYEYAEHYHSIFLEKGIRRVHPLFPAQSYPGVVATQLAISLGVRGPALCLSTACTSAADAIGMAWLHLRAGLVDRAIVGGTEAPLTPLLFASFDRLGALSRRNDAPAEASRPFADDRDGFVMSEGAGMLVLETERAAEERGATPLATLAGYGATSDAHHPLSPSPDGAEAARAMSLALEAAGLEPGDVDHVNAHAIGSPTGDPCELEALRRIFGERAAKIPISAIKSLIGHTMGAAPALELIASVQTLRHDLLPPTRNLDPPPSGPGFDFVTHEARPAAIRTILSTTFGFGSRNAVLAVHR